MRRVLLKPAHWGDEPFEAIDMAARNAGIGRIVARQAQLRQQIDAIVTDMEGGQA